MSEIESTCPYCGVGCGLSVEVEESQNEVKLLLGSQTHPANFGRLCSKGSALAQTINTDQARLIAPTVDGKEHTWDDASEIIAQRIQRSIAEHGKESVAFYLSGQLLTEDYYVANKLMKGFIGTANVDTNSRLCMSSAVAAYKRAFGADAVPCSYEDLEVAELIVLIGSNAAWTHPVLYQRMQAAKERNPKLQIVLLDPRKTVTCDIADVHLQLKPGSDGFLFQGLLSFLIDNNYVDQDYVEQHTEGFDEAKQVALNYDLQTTASQTGLSETQLIQFFEVFASTDKTISFYSQGINQSATGTDKCNAIINCHLAMGKIGYAGAGPFSITGQPNAMGGREVGGLANMLAAHMDFTEDDTARVQRFWNSPTIASGPGLKAVDLFDAVHKGEIKVLWIMATNPAVSLPDSNYVRQALERCDTVIVSDVTHTDTTGYADIVLPALAWGEKDGTVTNSERRISRQRSFMRGPGLAKADWWAVAQVAKKMGFDQQFDYQSSYDVFIEHAALSGFENSADSKRCFDISGLSHLAHSEYDALKPIQWPVNALAPNGTKRLFADGQFFTQSGKAQFVSATAKHASGFIRTQTDGGYAFVLNSGRLRDQWHTMTRTGNAPSLTTHDEVPFVQLHPDDAVEQAIEPGNFIRLTNKLGNAVLRVDISNVVNKGQLFAPIHWNDQFSSQGVINTLTPSLTDPVSGQPESKASAVNIEKFEATHWARIVTTTPLLDQSLFSYWATHKFEHGYVTLIASDKPIDARELILAAQAQTQTSQAPSFSHYTNPLTGFESGVLNDSSEVSAVYFCAKSPNALPSSVWLLESFQSDSRVGGLLRGEQGHPDSLVCACFATSRKAIELACEQNSLSLSQLSERLGCGSKCGSCKPEINILIQELNSL